MRKLHYALIESFRLIYKKISHFVDGLSVIYLLILSEFSGPFDHDQNRPLISTIQS